MMNSTNDGNRQNTLHRGSNEGASRKGISKGCFNYALRLLVRKDYTEHQITQKLMDRYAKLHQKMMERKAEKEQQQDAFIGLEFLKEGKKYTRADAQDDRHGHDGDAHDAPNDRHNGVLVKMDDDGDAHDDRHNGVLVKMDDAHDAPDDAHDAPDDAPDEGEMIDTVTNIIDELKQRGYIDDQRYAAEFIRTQSKKYGEYRIRQGLKNRGIIPTDQMFQSINHNEQLPNTPTTKDVATNLAQKYALKHKRKPIAKIKAGLYNHLLYRGFPSEIASEITKTTIDNIDT